MGSLSGQGSYNSSEPMQIIASNLNVNLCLLGASKLTPLVLGACSGDESIWSSEQNPEAGTTQTFHYFYNKKYPTFRLAYILDGDDFKAVLSDTGNGNTQRWFLQSPTNKDVNPYIISALNVTGWSMAWHLDHPSYTVSLQQQDKIAPYPNGGNTWNILYINTTASTSATASAASSSAPTSTGSADKVNPTPSTTSSRTATASSSSSDAIASSGGGGSSSGGLSTGTTVAIVVVVVVVFVAVAAAFLFLLKKPQSKWKHHALPQDPQEMESLRSSSLPAQSPPSPLPLLKHQRQRQPSPLQQPNIPSRAATPASLASPSVPTINAFHYEGVNSNPLQYNGISRPSAAEATRYGTRQPW